MVAGTRGTLRQLVLLTGLTLASVAAAQAQTPGPGAAMDARSLVRAKFDAWTAGTGSPYELLADDVSWTITGNSAGAGVYRSREAFMAGVIRPFNARMSEPLKPTVHQIYQEGNTVVVHFDAVGTARDGVPYRNTYAWFLEMRGDRIVRAVAFFDSIAFDDFWKRVAPAAS